MTIIGFPTLEHKSAENKLQKALKAIDIAETVEITGDEDDVYFPRSAVHHGRGTLVADALIFNREELKKKYSLKAETDEELILALIEEHGHENINRALEDIRGIYAFSYKIGKLIIFGRDILGMKPLWFTKDGSFATEKKMLLKAGFTDIKEVEPRDFIFLDIETGHEVWVPRDFFSILPENTDDEFKIIDELEERIIKAIEERIPSGKKFGIMFSGGVDSTIIAFICKKLKKKFTCYTAGMIEEGMETPQDIVWAQKIADELQLNLKRVEFDLKETAEYIPKIIKIIESTSPVKVGVALPEFVCCEAASKDGVEVLFSGLGTEEIFAGYERFRKAENINMECIAGLLSMHERDTYRDYCVGRANGIKMAAPFMDPSLIDYSVKIPSFMKISPEQSKIILRKVAEHVGLPREYSWRKKKAAQYGSKFDRALQVLAKRAGYNKKSAYLDSFED